ncbi:alpha/beta fold hydrolase [Paraflavitalea soli]|uniref:Alpha/beta fold hydrolase n=1 Tax=Paraflavitalea soli TaxID=2315862 RepID=A0A3B7MPW5_9BACT|nr:alpha/beta fold hydrolase [Paraflavitalea soli]AXY75090.1 alpha/beta fold hydrolase [Paraflavitalea soli]
MKQYIHVCLVLLWLGTRAQVLAAQDTSFVDTKVTLETKSGNIEGVLSVPVKGKGMPVALIIAGSGATDRDGNDPVMKRNSLKMLAAALLVRGIATLRYDKRGIAASAAAGKSEADLRFDDYVNDAKGWIELLRKDKRFSKVVVIGHSEGSLIGMIAAKGADQFVSIAGAGQSADKTIHEQLMAQPRQVQDLAFPILDSLAAGQLVKNVHPMLFSLFRPSVQPYMISWFRYDPQAEIRALSIPVLIVQGTSDIQVGVEDARRLAAANPGAKLVIIDNMNHVFKVVEGNREANLKTYSDPVLPIAPELGKSISDFILK